MPFAVRFSESGFASVSSLVLNHFFCLYLLVWLLHEKNQTMPCGLVRFLTRSRSRSWKFSERSISEFIASTPGTRHTHWMLSYFNNDFRELTNTIFGTFAFETNRGRCQGQAQGSVWKVNSKLLCRGQWRVFFSKTDETTHSPKNYHLHSHPLPARQGVKSTRLLIFFSNNSRILVRRGRYLWFPWLATVVKICGSTVMMWQD